ncbi:MAG: hypothetical protein QOI60_191, partial [Actinomycetota bacterium]|nr:hypothetical protein [Actinomycetota bacterium]
MAVGLAGVAGAVGMAAGRAQGMWSLERTARQPQRAISRRAAITTAVGLTALVVLGPFMAVLTVACSVGAAWVGKIRRSAQRQVLIGEQLIDAVAGLG